VTPERRSLLVASWAALTPRADALAAAFYRDLFARDPACARLFAGTDLRRQREKFVAMMDAIVAFDDDAGALVAAAAELARRHAGYGVRDSDYETATAALLQAIEQAGGGGSTPELRGVWREWLLVLTTVMRRAAT
jgi:hemoglobin-like flavoprotein